MSAAVVPESALPSQLRSRSKNKTVKALPAIDHNAQREKLKSIISLCDDEDGPVKPLRGKSTQVRQQAVKTSSTQPLQS